VSDRAFSQWDDSWELSLPPLSREMQSSMEWRLNELAESYRTSHGVLKRDSTWAREIPDEAWSDLQRAIDLDLTNSQFPLHIVDSRLTTFDDASSPATYGFGSGNGVSPYTVFFARLWAAWFIAVCSPSDSCIRGRAIPCVDEGDLDSEGFGGYYVVSGRTPAGTAFVVEDPDTVCLLAVGKQRYIEVRGKLIPVT